jgi:hypothetical protein
VDGHHAELRDGTDCGADDRAIDRTAQLGDGPGGFRRGAEAAGRELLRHEQVVLPGAGRRQLPGVV